MKQGVYDRLWFFILYAFLGWCIEVIYVAVEWGEVVNRGFLHGPVCPIYGFGMLIILFFLQRYSHNLPVLFFGSILLATALEFVVGYGLETIFHERWWDYSDMPLNIMGYVSLKFSLQWGLACVLVVKVVHPMIEKLVAHIPKKAGTVCLYVLLALLLGDLVITLLQLGVQTEQLRGGVLCLTQASIEL